jgi:hypothetical protein
LKDLVVQSDERQLLWQALRERTHQNEQYGQNKTELPGLDLDPGLLSLLLGIKELEANYPAQNDEPEQAPNKG